MPELPEVEFAARALRRWMDGHHVVEAEAPESRIFRGCDASAFERALRGAAFGWVERRGKNLLFAFSGGQGLFSHLGMTGKWVRIPKGQMAPPHVRASLLLENGERVGYVDPRMFGRLALVPVDELFDRPEVRDLGPDPLIDGLDPAWLHERLQRTRRAIKVALMDQAVIAGVGNIQATDALFEARIHPARPASSLAREEVDALVRAIDASIARTLEVQGDGDEITYMEEAGAANPFVVYGRAGLPCPRCGTTLEKMDVGGRTSAFCPTCQGVQRE